MSISEEMRLQPDYAKSIYFPGGLSGATHFLKPERIISQLIGDLVILGIYYRLIDELKARSVKCKIKKRGASLDAPLL